MCTTIFGSVTNCFLLVLNHNQAAHLNMVFAAIHLILNNRSDLKSFLVSHFTSRPMPYLQYIIDDRLQWSTELLSETKSMDTIDLSDTSAVSSGIPKVVSIGEGIDCLSLTLGSAMDEKPTRARVRDTALQKIDALDQINRWSSMLSIGDKCSRDAVIDALEDILSTYETRYVRMPCQFRYKKN